MGLIEGESPIPETYAGPAGFWWDPANAKSAVVLDGDERGPDLLVKAHLDWNVVKRRLTYEALAPVKDGGRVLQALVPNWVATVRESDDAFLGMVTPSYHEFQNAEASDMLDAVLDEGGAHGHSAGSLYGGRICWMLAKFDHSLHVKGDGSPLDDYLLALWGHDGRHALTFASTMVRVWCGNTAAQAIDGSTGRINLRHTSGMEQRVPEVRRALDLHFKYVETLEGFLNSLADKPLTDDEFAAFTVALFPTSPDVEKPVRTLAKRESLLDLYRTSENLLDVPSTAYRAYQATVEWSDHRVNYRDTKKANGNDRRALAIIEGSAYDLKTRAAALLAKA